MTTEATTTDVDLDSQIAEAAAGIAEALLGEGKTDQLVAQLVPQLTATMTTLIAPMQQAHAGASAQIKVLEETVAAMAERLAEPVPTVVSSLRSDDPRDILGLSYTQANPEAVGSVLDGRFSSLADFMGCVYKGTGGRDRLMRVVQAGDINAVLEGEELPGGGALVPEEFRAALLKMALMPTSIRGRATVLPMSTATLDIPYLRDTSHAGGQIYGGIETYWLEAGESMTLTEPEFAQVHLVVKNLVAGCSVLNTLLADSFQTVPALLGMLYPEALRRAEERAFLRGSGAGKPLGIFNADAMIDVGRQGGGNSVQAMDIHEMEGRLLPGSEMRAVWMIHPGLRPDLGELQLGGIQYWQEDLSEPRPMTLNGRPVILSEFCSAPGSAGDIVLVDWMYYLIGDRQAMSMAVSPHARFEELQTVFRFNERIDGQPWIDSELELEHGGAAHTVSPFVRLAG